VEFLLLYFKGHSQKPKAASKSHISNLSNYCHHHPPARGVTYSEATGRLLMYRSAVEPLKLVIFNVS
jgi:hypothetical protein